MNSNVSYPVMEMFFTVQGEGSFTGCPAFFIRLGGCDVGCVWCDVKESWDASKHPLKSVETLTKAAAASGAPIVVITGGEPAMHNLEPLTSALQNAGLRTHIETSGAHPLSGTWDWVTFSPKKFKAPLLGIYPLADELKVIVYHKSDFAWAEEHAQAVKENCLLYLQAEWEKREVFYPMIMAHLQQSPRWRISVQTHKYIGVE